MGPSERRNARPRKRKREDMAGVVRKVKDLGLRTKLLGGFVAVVVVMAVVGGVGIVGMATLNRSTTSLYEEGALPIVELAALRGAMNEDRIAALKHGLSPDETVMADVEAAIPELDEKVDAAVDKYERAYVGGLDARDQARRRAEGRSGRRTSRRATRATSAAKSPAGVPQAELWAKFTPLATRRSPPPPRPVSSSTWRSRMPSTWRHRRPTRTREARCCWGRSSPASSWPSPLPSSSRSSSPRRCGSSSR